MNNSDMPAMPTHEDSDGYYADPKTCKQWHPLHGLTKREYFAGLAMQSIISAKHEEIKWWSDECKQQSFAQSAVAYADALLQQLQATESGE